MLIMEESVLNQPQNNNIKNSLLETTKIFLCLLIGFACFFINIISDEFIGGVVRIFCLSLIQCGINERIAFITTEYITANLIALLAYLLLKKQRTNILLKISWLIGFIILITLTYYYEEKATDLINHSFLSTLSNLYSETLAKGWPNSFFTLLIFYILCQIITVIIYKLSTLYIQNNFIKKLEQ